jgi:hypothetical protein
VKYEDFNLIENNHSERSPLPAAFDLHGRNVRREQHNRVLFFSNKKFRSDPKHWLIL